ncbi:hypothetical protein Tco_0586544 [Tanacetum coccineum]
MRGFLWCQGGLSRGKAKVAWEVVCLPKDKGGLGIRRIDLFNKALMTTHIWKLFSMKESLWVKWIHKYKIRDCNFWELPCRGNMTWGWRKILPLRPLIREFFKYKIGIGNSLSIRLETAIMDGLNTSSKVSDVFQNGNVVWPQDLVARYPLLGSVVGPNSVGSIDTLEWRDNVGVVKPFSMNAVWQALRPREDKITWVDVCGIELRVGLSNVAPSIDLIIDVIIPTTKRRTLKCVIAKLVVEATAYFIWHERNCRLFKKAKRSEDQAHMSNQTAKNFKLGKIRPCTDKSKPRPVVHKTHGTNPGFPGRLVSGDSFLGRHIARDKWYGKARTGFLLGDILGRHRRAHIVSVKHLSVTVDGFPGRHVA